MTINHTLTDKLIVTNCRIIVPGIVLNLSFVPGKGRTEEGDATCDWEYR